MKYPAQSDLWRLDHVIRAKPVTNGSGQSRVLGRFRQIFPITLFPGELIVEELRIVYVQKNGPWANNVISIMSTDIACVNASSGPFFGLVHIQSLTGGPEILIEHLLRQNVYKIRSLVEGIALAAREGLKIEAANLEEEKQNLLRAGSIVTG
ncbi:hypothetical protein A2697_02275 [Candidatus Curtissbacteria bacterium RIFCSPHIGHO2_01_FULL_41_44]|uniref:Uncharacterized protein n=1 Tax=Candidatus Curtissbacteria bacterium RIFCSPLOWO2_01_FULL_42_50 TaxID=1797730 RepID=A0A1F5H816_9BACT|nr:MAG: hypothetical protein A3C33_01440 [Candidatus Curtissbacteria bacterium RIFCSPHIGHO2_02_FULL_42_58]OGD94697.1 MAG: hypothetical protein A2697_02275 [Candidatus Curtissbacteria bacterium RIFCSPHIGHO2_01_FULL_41_44]OGD97003.1 MAG: hypothetical protein A3E71_01525 [Candidatus Curtissbacteria bacterium RIFCSPHIGHO2_12_FULL_42_33]OGE00212.1 MAG: hypothetical protein A3B54_02520 [Candidatus Curtissbacteria bacterium RIFCSPLOWO2_01_FULL_42_50]OGE02633.1 MAG: hypothetical protein A3G16_01360 [Ca